MALSFPGIGMGETVVDLPPVMEVPDGYPPEIGHGEVTIGDQTFAYYSYDFSVGAFDSSVQFRKDYDCSGKGSCKDTGKVLLSSSLYPDANPDAEADVVVIRGVFARLPNGPRKTRAVTVEIRDVGGVPGAFLRSRPGAKLSLLSFSRGKDGSDSYGDIKVSVTAVLCEAREEAMIKGGACHPFAAIFESEVQFDSL